MGTLGWEVSALGFGLMRLPTRRKSMLSRVNFNEAIKIIRSGIDQGINYLDTALVYNLGGSEKVLAQALQDGYREKVYIANKSPLYFIRKSDDFDKYLKRQLDRVQTDYFDVYLFHGLSRNRFDQVIKLNLIDKMVEAKEEGLIKHIGFSFHDTFLVFKEILEYFDWEVVQIQYNYMDTGMQATTEGLKLAHEKGMATVIMEPLKGGLLANPPKEAIDIMLQTKSHRTPVDWALQFLWNLPEVSTVISGMSSQKMVDENCRSADRSGINSLSIEDLEVINQLTEAFRKQIIIPCTYCQYCMPCQFGVNIPENFAYLNYFSHERGFKRWRVKRRYKQMISNAKRVNIETPNGNASLCTRCMECVDKCPQEIMIPDELEKVHAILGNKKEISDYY